MSEPPSATASIKRKYSYSSTKTHQPSDPASQEHTVVHHKAWKELAKVVQNIFRSRPVDNVEACNDLLAEVIDASSRDAVFSLLQGTIMDRKHLAGCVLLKGCIVLRNTVEKFQEQDFVDAIVKQWLTFFHDILPEIEAVFCRLAEEDPSDPDQPIFDVRGVALSVFRDTFVCQTSLEKRILHTIENHATGQTIKHIQHMLLILQGLPDVFQENGLAEPTKSILDKGTHHGTLKQMVIASGLPYLPVRNISPPRRRNSNNSTASTDSDAVRSRTLASNHSRPGSLKPSEGGKRRQSTSAM